MSEQRTSEPDEGQRRNLEFVRSGLEAFQRGDVEAVLALIDENVEVFSSRELANPGTYHGHEGFFTWLGRWLEAWDDFRIEITGLDHVGERHVVASIHQSARGKSSGIPVEMDLAYMWEIRNEQVVGLCLYPTTEEALRIAAERDSGVE